LRDSDSIFGRAERALIRTVSARGYQFTCEIRILSASPDKAEAGVATAEPASVLPPTNAPKPVSELIGREEELSEIMNLLATHWLVTLTGAGGIGKTTLALALAHELQPRPRQPPWQGPARDRRGPRTRPATRRRQSAAAAGIDHMLAGIQHQQQAPVGEHLRHALCRSFAAAELGCVRSLFSLLLRSSHKTRRWRGRSRANPSLKPNSLLAGKIQGISSIRARRRANGGQKGASNQSLTGQFPTHPNREFFAALQGIKSGDQGNFCLDQGIPLSSAVGVRRDKAALSSGCKPHPAIRSSRKQPEQAWRRRNV
jgi:hypothetical protein